ncbi:MAG: acylphosphatase [Pelotomaculaceae bacterium]|jgi:acylphosphatase|uniref:Acylphosphatase n=1 Tax=anaerobic digester metagenome TaxID=1263854 RepID=A0A485M309_9ZZZZ|nr:acylphosphatase [Bacillota bacterium]HHU86681.1 acylphosphatase [Peptococcaceae bacterium]
MSTVRVSITIKGRVQGVYFRSETREQALALGVRGWVKNRRDGAVEGVFEGERESVEKLVEWCRQGPPAAEVTEVQAEWEELPDNSGDFSGFRIKF